MHCDMDEVGEKGHLIVASEIEHEPAPKESTRPVWSKLRRRRTKVVRSRF